LITASSTKFSNHDRRNGGDGWDLAVWPLREGAVQGNVAWIRSSTGSHLLTRCYTLPGLESIADDSLPYKQRATDM
jgi:hypothetical protein